MAIAFDTSGAARVNTVGATSTVSLTAAEANELAIIFIWSGSTTAPTVTVGGSAATLIGSITFATVNVLKAYYFLNPPTTATDYSGTTSDAKTEIHALLYKGASQSGVPDSFATLDVADPNPFTISTTVIATSWLVSAARDYAEGTTTAGVGTTLRNAGIGLQSGDSNALVGTGSQSMGWVPNTANNDTVGFIVSFAPAGGGATTRNLLLTGVGS